MPALLALLTELLAFLPLAAGAFAVAYGGTALSIRLSNRLSVLDHANERSSHEHPTPRLGGLGLTAGLLLVPLVLYLQLRLGVELPAWLQFNEAETAFLTAPRLWSLAAGLAVLCGLMLVDDLQGMPAWTKLAAQVVIAAGTAACGWRFENLHVPPMASLVDLHPLVGGVIATGWLVLLMNVVNFMDGINGIAGVYGRTVAMAVFLATFLVGGAEPLLVPTACLFGACLGYLRWNHPRAFTFLGDCGSQPLGYFIGLLGIAVATVPTSFPLPILGYLAIVGLFVFDVVYTIGRRATRGENLARPHREHLYQRHLLASGGNHATTLAFVDNHLSLMAAAGAIYLFFAFDPGRPVLQVILLAIAIAIAGHYLHRVRQLEHPPR